VTSNFVSIRLGRILRQIVPSGCAELVSFALLLGCATLVYSQTQTLTEQQVNNLRVWHSPDSTRIVFDVSADVRHTMFTLQNPLRLVVDIQNANLKIKLPELDEANPHIRAVRSGRPNAEQLRFVFELKKDLISSSFLLSPNELYGHRLVVDLEDRSATLDTLPAQTQSATASVALPPTQKPVVTQIPAKPRRLVVAIDAGHGGEDPGAIGHRGSHEKKLTLAIAKRLADKVNEDPRMRAVLVRTGDYYIDLNKRRLKARNLGADIFISVHADAFRKRSARGMSVFALSQRGATSAMARALAAKENASDLIGGVSLAHKDEVLAQVLVDLSMTNTISESVNLGGRVLKELSKLGKLHSRRVEQAGFAVLKSPDMPSILIETGFITNPDEERKLRSASYQRKLAAGIYAAIEGYYQQTPYYSNTSYASPSFEARPNSKSKNRNPKKYHTVVRGDSLSKIAERYKVSLRDLKRENGLRNNTAVLGKRLRLPANAKVSGVVRPVSRPSVHIVKRGDSLSKISAQYNVTINSLKRLNQLSKSTVYLGQKLKLPAVAKSVVNKPVSTPSKPRVHKVKRGDTLSEIADKYGTTMRKIMTANNLRSRTILLGQKLKIPK